MAAQEHRRLVCQGEVRPGMVVAPYWVDDSVEKGAERSSLPKPSRYVDSPWGPVPVYTVGQR